MSVDALHNAIGMLDDELIEKTDSLRKQKRRTPYLIYALAGTAACFCIVVAAANIINYTPKADGTNQNTDSTVTPPDLEQPDDDDMASGDEGLKSEEKTEGNTLNDIYRPCLITLKIKVDEITDSGFYGIVYDELTQDVYTAGTRLNVVLPLDTDLDSTVKSDYGIEIGDIVTVKFNAESGGTIYAERGIEIEKQD